MELSNLLLQLTLRYLLAGHFALFTGPVARITADSLQLLPVDSIIIMQHAQGCTPVQVKKRIRLKARLQFLPDSVEWTTGAAFYGYAPDASGTPTRYKVRFIPWQHQAVCLAVSKIGCYWCKLQDPQPRHSPAAAYYYRPIKLYAFPEGGPPPFEAPDEPE